MFSRGFVVNILLFDVYSKECHIKKKKVYYFNIVLLVIILLYFNFKR